MKTQNSNKPIFYKDKMKQKRMKENTKDSSGNTKATFRPKTIRQIIGGIIDDAIFLEKLSRNENFGNLGLDPVTGDDTVDRFAEIIRDNAREAVEFFEKKTGFWDECSRMAPKHSASLLNNSKKNCEK